MSNDVEGTGQRFVCLNPKVKVLTLRSRTKVKMRVFAMVYHRLQPNWFIVCYCSHSCGFFLCSILVCDAVLSNSFAITHRVGGNRKR